MKISRFMSEALFKDETGYYRTKNPIGKNADFITAPEISQVFGEILAAYFLQIADNKKSKISKEKIAKKKISFVEMGAGKGTLFLDILNSIKKLALKKIPQALDFLEATTFHIIEINEVLQKIQQQNLQQFNNISWYKNFADFAQKNHDCEIFFLSNELFDCFAIDQFVLTEIGWRERVIKNNKFTLAPFDKKIHQFVEKEINTFAPILKPLGAVFEYSAAARNFMTQLCKALKKQGGIAVNFDYGYEKNNFANTLQAVKNHQKVDVLENAGNVDITALVDFSALQKIAEKSDLNFSLISQKEFLTSLGIEERRTILLAKNPEKKSEINSAIDRLIDSAQMGELFKCFIIWKNS